MRGGIAAFLKHIRFVLVRPQISGNIGSTARVLTNFGFSRFSIVRPSAPINEDAKRLAVHGKPLLEKIDFSDSVRDAVRDDHVVMGTTRRLGHRRRHHHLTPEEASQMLLDVVAHSKVSVLFGPEDDGLSNDDLAVCHWLVTIPSPSRHHSLNLSHAVGIIAYELARHLTAPSVYPRATAAEMESFFQHFHTVLQQIRFLKGDDRHRMMMKFRHMFHRASLDKREIATLHGVLSQIQYMLEVKKGISADLKTSAQAGTKDRA